jgi:hypothetical protein
MQRYINQLLQDIEEATNNVPEPWYPIEDVDDEFGVLPWMENPENAPTKSLEEWTKLKKEQFPPENRLTEPQLSQLLTAIKKMLDAYNCSAVFQISVPENIQYRVIRARFQQEVPMLKANYFFFEFCDKEDQTNRSDCILGAEYCHCAFFEAFFERFDEGKGNENDLEPNIDPYEEYMLRRRYGEHWREYIQYQEEDIDFDAEAWDEDEDDIDDYNEDPDNLFF